MARERIPAAFCSLSASQNRSSYKINYSKNPTCAERIYRSYLVSDKVLHLRNRTSGKEIGDQRSAEPRFTVVRLCEERFVHIEGPVKFIIFVPFILRIVNLIVHCRSRKMELRRNAEVSPNSQNKTRHSPHSGRSE